MSTDPERIEGWVGLVGWPTADSLPTNGHMSGKVRQPKTDVLVIVDLLLVFGIFWGISILGNGNITTISTITSFIRKRSYVRQLQLTLLATTLNSLQLTTQLTAQLLHKPATIDLSQQLRCIIPNLTLGNHTVASLYVCLSVASK